jgi:hypothetical protein
VKQRNLCPAPAVVVGMKRAVLVLIACLAAVPVPSAHADEAVDQVLRETPLAGYGGWAAWSRTVGDRHQLVFRNPQGVIVIPTLPTSSRPYDVSLGPDANSNVVAVYQRCTSSGCDIRRLSTASGREQTLRSVSSPTYREATPAIWRSTVAFTRRVRGCDVPYVKDLRSSRPSKRLLRTKCLQTAAGHMAVRGTRIFASSLDLSGTDENGSGRKVSEIRRYSSGGGATKIIARQTFGEESNLFGQLAIDESHVTTVRVGVHGPHAFVRVRTTGGTAFASPAHLALTGAFAKSSSGTSLYLQAQDDETDSCGPVPCRVIRSPQSPFGRVVRSLPPQLTIEPGFSGSLTRLVVADGEVLRTDPVPGVTVALKRRVNEQPERFEDTPFRAVTGPDGRYSIVAPGETRATAVAATEPVATWAGRGTP